ncbi:hypothetical protein MTO96_018163 [Rhipicephalus appendiculatus]
MRSRKVPILRTGAPSCDVMFLSRAVVSHRWSAAEAGVFARGAACFEVGKRAARDGDCSAAPGGRLSAVAVALRVRASSIEQRAGFGTRRGGVESGATP